MQRNKDLIAVRSAGGLIFVAWHEASMSEVAQIAAQKGMAIRRRM
jgi:hypothetical protein